MKTTSPDFDEDTRQALKLLASNVVEHCPDMWSMARTTAQEILSQRTGQNLDPDKVFWHRFDNAESSTRSFTGWEHVGAPVESFTLPQLVMHRFNTHDQDNADLLQQLGGFYSVDSHARLYNETNEIRMLGQDVLSDFWQIDFASLFKARLSTFWETSSEDYRSLAKLNFITKAVEDLDSSALQPEHFTTVMKAVAGSFSTPPTLEKIHQRDEPPSGMSIRALDIGGYVASDILRIVDEQQRQIIYMPSNDGTFHVFETVADLHWWLLVQANDPLLAPVFMSHFPLSSYEAQGTDVGLHNVLVTLFMSHARGDHRVVNQKDQIIEGDAFDWLTDNARQRMHEEAYTSLQSNAELRKKLWIGYLSATANVTGALGMLCWPVALAALGADLASLGLDIDQAVNGRNTADREAGVQGAIFSGIDALFNSLVVFGAAGEIKSLGETASVEGAGAAAILPAEPVPLPPHLATELENSPIQNFVANVLLVDEPGESGLLKGVHTHTDGNFYIEINSLPYQVRYLGEMKTWVIVDPVEPYSFFRHFPVQLADNGEWSLLERPGLRGGGRLFAKKPWGSPRQASSYSPLPDTPYDIPERYRAKLDEIASSSSPHWNDLANLSDQLFNEAIADAEKIRQSLLEDAESFFEQYEQDTRPSIPHFEANATAKTILETLLEESDGIVVGESHSSVASKKFLIDNMGVLAKQKVKTLYMEHVMKEFQGADLEHFNRTGKMKDNLRSYLKSQDKGHKTDPTGTYTFEALYKSANDHHILIKPIDCMVSYRQIGDSVEPRIKMFNFYASKAIQADQQLNGPTRWVALVGESHANTFNGVPGLSEMNKTIGLRIADVQPGSTVGIGIDPGETRLISSISGKKAFVKNDLLLTMSTKPAPSLADRLPLASMFTLVQTEGREVLVHRSRTGELVRTPIDKGASGVRIIRPKWVTISNRWYPSMTDLLAALRVIGLRQMP
ncbi:Dermonecrotic toxin [compost metagenome]